MGRAARHAWVAAATFGSVLALSLALSAPIRHDATSDVTTGLLIGWALATAAAPIALRMITQPSGPAWQVPVLVCCATVISLSPALWSSRVATVRWPFLLAGGAFLFVMALWPFVTGRLIGDRPTTPAAIEDHGEDGGGPGGATLQLTGWHVAGLVTVSVIAVIAFTALSNARG